MPQLFLRRGILFTFLFLFLAPEFLAAATLRINQPKIRLSIPSGGTQAGAIQVDNTSEDTLKVKVYLEDWVYASLNDGTKIFSAAGQTLLSGSQWISFSPSEFTLLPFGRQVVNYRVKVPEGAKGGHYAVLFFESAFGEKDTREGEGVGMNLLVRIGSLFYIETEGTIVRNAGISNLSVKRNGKTLEIKADLKNTGNVDVTCTGTFHIMDAQGMIFARGEFNKIYTLPQDSSQLSSSTQETIPKGTYDLILTIDLGKALEELNLGRGPVVTKEAQLEIGENGEVINLKEQ